jgi:Host cell surface-exposed lipoprotein
MTDQHHPGQSRQGGPQNQAPWQYEPQQPQGQPRQPLETGQLPSAPQPAPVRRARKQRGRGAKILGVIVYSAVLVLIGALIGSSAASKSGTPAAASTQAPATSATTSPASGPSPAATTPSPAAPAAPQYTPAQQQAIEAAEQYLQTGGGFSRLGLIQQLDSPDGNGFPRSIAKFAVNHIKVNWDQQAAEAAKGYMKQGGFSYSSMVQQLDSPYGDDFTYSQAVYGAKAVGL